MRKKYNDNSPVFADWTLKKLKDEAEMYHDIIYGQNSCYGSHDILNYDGVLEELHKRGVDITSKLSFN